ncbi:MAG TPA: isoprenylcysteine carboxylmethyltransferase family protein [Virgibacillus sp.]|nr:isoprenylcysteine carboxylmethyltransferase family protein [Virgibacillus sp.]
MAIWMVGFLIFLIGQRLIELFIAKRNEAWMKRRGGIEIGDKHYKWFILLHTLFFMSMLVESIVRNNHDIQLNYVLFSLFIMLQIGRVWCIYSLGRFWNTKIIVIPHVHLIRSGPYRYLKHPNYVIVAMELIVIPLFLTAYITALIFPFLHILLLMVRIPSENRALNEQAISP